ncbi:hypothetical protein [Streptomyces termitum]|uniref:hypothetical protein n=1 Tax=Streptomyces termitum TaxID=67368 RepID=UPI0033BD01A1
MDTEVLTALRARWTRTTGAGSGPGAGRAAALGGTAAVGVCAVVAVAASALPAWRRAR